MRGRVIRGQVRPRDVVAGVVAAGVALVAMAGIAAVGLWLLDADRLAGLTTLTAAVVGVAVGGAADLSTVPASDLPVAVRGSIEVMPLGVSLVGAVVLGALISRGSRDGLLVRGAAAAVAFSAGIGAVTRLARGTVTLRLPDGEATAGGGLGASGCSAGGAPGAAPVPFGGGQPPDVLDAEFAVALWPTLLIAMGWVVAVVGLCWLAARFHVAARGLRAALWLMGGVASACLLAAWAFGGSAAAGGVLLVLPLAVFGALPFALGVPMTLSSEGELSCALEGIEPLTAAGLLSAGGPLMWASSIALLACGVAAARTSGPSGRPLRRAMGIAVRLAAVVGAALALMTLLSRVSVDLGINVFGSSVPILEAQLAANPLVALGAGLAGGGVAGFAGSLLVSGFARLGSVSWPTWNDQNRR